MLDGKQNRQLQLSGEKRGFPGKNADISSDLRPIANQTELTADEIDRTRRAPISAIELRKM
jgi:hypothetical protein